MMHSLQYGPAESQCGDLYLPDAKRPPVVCLLHGGFWRMPYGRDECDPVARDLAARGFAVWNLEYRRLGESVGGWPQTLEDVASGLDHLATLAAEGADLDLDRLVVAGHSAGGQLALWAAARNARSALLRRPARVRATAAAGLAAIVDLQRTHQRGAGNAAVRELFGGSAELDAERVAAASPIALVPLGVTQLILHGAEDEVLPVESARDYVRAARAAGDSVVYREPPRAGHMDCLDPASEAHDEFRRWLDVVARPGAA